MDMPRHKVVPAEAPPASPSRQRTTSTTTVASLFFVELDSDVRGSVKFGDASAVEIKGVGSVIFVAKTGDQRLLTGVYYIPARGTPSSAWDSLMRTAPCADRTELRMRDRHHRLLAKASFRAKEKLELVHGDLCGPVTPATPGGRCYFLFLIDDLSRYPWVVLLSSKGEAADAISATNSRQRVKKASSTLLRAIQPAAKLRRRAAQTDGCGSGSAPPQAERDASCVREAVLTAVYILNRSPTKALDGRTPYEAWHGRKPAVSHLRVFGCLAFAKELGHIGKHDDRSTPGVFIGYTEGSKAYRILDPKTQPVRTSRDVVFNEGRGWAWGKAAEESSTPTYDDFIVEYIHFEAAREVGSSSSTSSPTSVPMSPSTPVVATPPPQPPRTPTPAVTPSCMSTPAHVEHNPVKFASPLSHDRERIDAYHGGAPLWYRTMENLLSDQPVPG
ncbi:hypothetical protein QYE76_066013 [Lolium multiflorum]|uniref:Uncharacterized protein n=1 Tax=Lolium multiflorum TaxID=4521 RepID=A0AAD8SBF3_LOLMU|nr:hypothetical protein QYE76_066013 [Lolium multiflorum]